MRASVTADVEIQFFANRKPNSSPGIGFYKIRLSERISSFLQRTRPGYFLTYDDDGTVVVADDQAAFQELPGWNRKKLKAYPSINVLCRNG
jgi:hypothetical protein